MKMRHYEEFLLYSGEYYSIYFHAEAQNLSEVFEYYFRCDAVTRASLLYLVKRMGDAGRIYDQTKFRIEDRVHKIYVFKPRKERFFCFFFMGKKIIITSAYRKWRDKVDHKALEKAIRIRRGYTYE